MYATLRLNELMAAAEKKRKKEKQRTVWGKKRRNIHLKYDFSYIDFLALTGKGICSYSVIFYLFCYLKKKNTV